MPDMKKRPDREAGGGRGGSARRAAWGPRLRPDEPRAREFEFGVAFPGRVGPREKWTSTLFAGDPAAPVDFAAVFGRNAPVVLELGCGNGRFLIASAMSRPNMDHFGVDEVQRVIDFAVMRANRRCVPNVRFQHCDGAAFLGSRASPGSLAEVHVYHPQPYFEESQRRLRMVNPGFFLGAWRSLCRGGALVLQTDNVHYWRYMLETAPALFEVRVQEGPWPDAPRGRTRREIVARRKGFEIYRMTATRKDSITDSEAAVIASGMPEPAFDANRVRRKQV